MKENIPRFVKGAPHKHAVRVLPMELHHKNKQGIRGPSGTPMKPFQLRKSTKTTDKLDGGKICPTGPPRPFGHKNGLYLQSTLNGYA